MPGARTVPGIVVFSRGRASPRLRAPSLRLLGYCLPIAYNGIVFTDDIKEICL